MDVVLTRSADEGSGFVAALGPSVNAVYLPVTEVISTDEDRQRLIHAVAAIETYERIFVASRQIVSLLTAALSAHGWSPRAAPVVGAVGPATSAALAAAGFSVEYLGDTGEAAAAVWVAGGVATRRILAPRAAGGRTEAVELLRAAGAEVTAVECYRTRAVERTSPSLVPGRTALCSGAAAACLTFAPSHVEALANLLRPFRLAELPVRWFAIGPTTAAALIGRGVVVAGVAAAPTPTAMAAAFAAVYP